MWEIIQNVCVGIVGFEIIIAIIMIIMICHDSEHDNSDTSDDEHQLHCTITDEACIHTSEWNGICQECPVYISYEERKVHNDES